MMKKILIVNNDLDTMSLLQRWLERKNYQVLYSGKIWDVTKIMDDFKPDLLIIDGIHSRLISQLKQDLHTKDIPILLMTGYVISQNRRNEEVDDVIEKPFDLAEMQKKIEALLGQEETLEG